MSGKEFMMMNTVMILDYLNSEEYEALSKVQGFILVHPNKIMRKPYCVRI